MEKVIRETIQRDGEEFDLLIEVEDGPGTFDRSGAYGEMRGARGLVDRPFEKGMELIRTCAEQVAATVEKVSKSARPTEVEIQLGVKFSGEVGAVVSKTGAEAQLQVTLKWNRKETA